MARVVASLLLIMALAAVPTAAAQPAEQTARPYHVRYGVPIPVRDGTRLSAVIVQPRGPTRPLPVVFVFTPYGADRYYPVATYFARRGYVGVIVDVRGRGDSEGTFKPYVNDAADGFDVIAWLARQPFSDGRVVMRGASYTGALQWQIAALQPPALKTAVPAAAGYHGLDSPSYRGVGNPYRARWSALVSGRGRNTNFNGDLDYWRGLNAEVARGELAFEGLSESAGLPRDLWPEAQAHPVLDSYWEKLNPSREALSRITIPLLTITGQHDGAQLGELEHWRRFVASGAPAVARSYLLVGPWDHAGVTSPARRIGGFDFGAASELDMLALHDAWYRHVLDGAPLPAQLRGRFTYFVAGAADWRGADTLAPIAPTRYFLASPGAPASSLARAGAIAHIAPPTDSDRFTYDPTAATRVPQPYFSDESGPDHLVNMAMPRAIDGNGLIYETAPLAAGGTLAGFPVLTVRARYNVPDTDLTAVLFAVNPDGTGKLLAWDVLRLRYRNGYANPVLLRRGAVETARLEMSWAAHRLVPGARLRLVLSSPGIGTSWQRNRNTGGDVARETIADSRTALIDVVLGRGGTTLDLPIREGAE